MMIARPPHPNPLPKGRGSCRRPLSPWGERQSEGVFQPLSPQDVYRSLMQARIPGSDEFDAHTVASILAISSAGASGQPQTAAAGLTAVQFGALVAEFFPRAAAWRLFALSESVERSADEACLLDLLERCTTSRTAFEALLAAMIARRSQQPNHLWQDLGLNNRGELSELMTRHFKPLAARNTGDMKWKKFFYRLICADASYTLCTAPSCAECDDFEQCFGEETGESLLARVRRAAEAG
ncbi:MAG: nitrogen fixation protein NifQ [Rhodomicrobium sp.]